MKEEKYTLTTIKVQYKTLKGIKINSFFDRQIKKLANEYRLSLFGSGYNSKTKERDLEFNKKFFIKRGFFKF